jgi:hypothetical protein
LADVGSIPHGQLLPTARAMVRAQHQLHDVHRQQCIRSLERWQATSSFQVLDLASKLLPGLSLHLRNFTATPSLSDICLEYVPHLDGSASVARACILQSHKNNLARALDLDWAGKHMPVMHTSMPLIVESKQEKAAVSKTSSCKEVGFCVCNPSGKRIGKLRSGFYLHLKGLCKPKSPGIQIIRFTNLPPTIVGHNIITGGCSDQCKSIAFLCLTPKLYLMFVFWGWVFHVLYCDCRVLPRSRVAGGEAIGGLSARPSSARPLAVGCRSTKLQRHCRGRWLPTSRGRSKVVVARWGAFVFAVWELLQTSVLPGGTSAFWGARDLT